MRPQPKRLDDLRRARVAAQGELDKANAQAEHGSADTLVALAQAEVAARELSDQMTVSAQVERNLKDNIASYEELLAALRAGLAAALQAGAALAVRAGAAGAELAALRWRLEEERAKVAPLVAARQREVDRFDRRIATKIAYATRAPLPALIPGKPAPTMSERFAAARAAEIRPPEGAAGGEPAAPPALVEMSAAGGGL